jgi:hypothetical protein
MVIPGKKEGFLWKLGYVSLTSPTCWTRESLALDCQTRSFPFSRALGSTSPTSMLGVVLL